MYTLLIFGLDREGRQQLAGLIPGYRLLHADSAHEFYSIAFSRLFDGWIIAMDHREFEDLALAELLNRHGTPPVVLYGSTQLPATLASQAEKLYPINDGCLTDGVNLLAQHLRNKEQQNRERYLAGYTRPQPGLEAIVTRSSLMHELLDLVKDVAPTDSPILIQGETGTGKELLANIFHNESRRRSGPFMAVNCGALPDNLLESELFGYEKGAFTGATSQHTGKIEHASGGTLFLDEIESMSAAMQVRLLRVLQEKSLQRLGGNEEIFTDFRVISATNTAPLDLLNSGRLRSDLYYRLSVFQVHIPPLRKRVEDIPLLVQHFINKKKKGGREYVRGLDNQAMKLLLSIPWQGNIRELQNVIERAVMLSASEIITPELIHIPAMPLGDTPLEVQGNESAFRPGRTLKSYKHLLQQTAERTYLVELLEYTEGRIGESAVLAGLTPRALYNKMKIHGLKKEDFRKSEK